MSMNFTQNPEQQLKALAIYQIAGGILGLGLTVVIISRLGTITGIILLILLFAIALYSFSIFCGVILSKNKKSALTYSLINQFLQLINFSIAGYGFQYIAGVYLSIGLDLTKSIIFQFNLGISAWRITINEDATTSFVNFNFVALFLIIFIDRIRNKIKRDTIDLKVLEQ